ncbi:MAG: hypothetical protein ACRCS0_15820 [Albidovulum sp.]
MDAGHLFFTARNVCKAFGSYRARDQALAIARAILCKNRIPVPDGPVSTLSVREIEQVIEFVTRH